VLIKSPDENKKVYNEHLLEKFSKVQGFNKVRINGKNESEEFKFSQKLPCLAVFENGEMVKYISY
jgi:ribosomal protein L3